MVKIELENLSKTFQTPSGTEEAVDNLNLTIDDGEFFTFVGPSGCGKTTSLRMIAGLETPTSGEIYFGGERVTDLSPQQRDVAMVFQNVVLFPHMTNRENIIYGLKSRGDTENLDNRVAKIAEMLDISDIVDKKPGQISGGQAQRVALGRAIIRDPNAILLDEPMSDLDAKLKIELRTVVQEIHEQIDTTVVYVTHDQEEAMTMSTSMGVMRDGNLVQVDIPGKIYDNPKNRYVAEFIGQPTINILDAAITDVGIELTDLGRSIALESSDLGRSSGEILFGVRPNHIRVSSEDSPSNWTAEVTVAENLGTRFILHLELDGVDVTAATERAGLERSVDSIGIEGFDRVFLFDPDDGEKVAELENVRLDRQLATDQ